MDHPGGAEERPIFKLSLNEGDGKRVERTIATLVVGVNEKAEKQSSDRFVYPKALIIVGFLEEMQVH